MFMDFFTYFVVGLAIIVSSYVLVSSDLRLSLACMAIQYLVAFLTIIQVWPIPLSAVIFISGWMAVIVIGSLNPADIFIEKSSRSGTIFRLFSSMLVCTFVFTLSPQIKLWLPIPENFILVGFIIFGIGLLQISLSNEPIKIIIGLLTLLLGFEVIYAPLEGSALVTGVLAAIHLSIAIVGSILASQPNSGETI